MTSESVKKKRLSTQMLSNTKLSTNRLGSSKTVGKLVSHASKDLNDRRSLDTDRNLNIRGFSNKDDHNLMKSKSKRSISLQRHGTTNNLQTFKENGSKAGSKRGSFDHQGIKNVISKQLDTLHDKKGIVSYESADMKRKNVIMEQILADKMSFKKKKDYTKKSAQKVDYF